MAMFWFPFPHGKGIKGDLIYAGDAKIYCDAFGGKGKRQYFSDDPYYTVIDQSFGRLLVRHHSLDEGFTGWFNIFDVKKVEREEKR